MIEAVLEVRCCAIWGVMIAARLALAAYGGRSLRSTHADKVLGGPF